MNVSSLVVLVIRFLLALIPASIADRKGYNKGGFYAYGLFLFIPALIHSLIIPDKCNNYEKQYQGNSLGYSIAASIFFWYNLIFVLGASVINGRYDDFTFLLGIAFSVVLWLVALLARKYKFALVVYGAFFIRSLYHLVKCIMNFASTDEYFISVRMYYTISNLLGVVCFALLLLIVVKTGIKPDNSALPKFIFVLPAILSLASSLVPLFGANLFRYYITYQTIMYVFSYFFGFMGYLFVGLFYLEDRKYMDTLNVDNSGVENLSVDNSSSNGDNL